MLELVVSSFLPVTPSPKAHDRKCGVVQYATVSDCQDTSLVAVFPQALHHESRCPATPTVAADQPGTPTLEPPRGTTPSADYSPFILPWRKLAQDQSSTQEVDSGSSRVQVHPQLHGKPEATLGYMSLALKIKKKTLKS